MMRTLKILHTSDWHLGRTLYGRSRYGEFASFLDWLAEIINQEQIDVLLVSGDVFDTSTPSNRAQELYYRFLCRVAAGTCRHAVIIAGNHDSPSFLSAPRELLKSFNIHVVGTVSEKPEDEMIVLAGKDGHAELLVCAVPHLRDRVVRTVEAGETVIDKERKLVEGVRDHYSAVVACAEAYRAHHQKLVPIIGMGHLFTAGGRTVEGDGVRDLYIGSLAHVPAHFFPAALDYLALGHLHVPQAVGHNDTRRYSGSPLPIGFGEAGQAKSVCLVSICPEDRSYPPQIRLVEVPVFQSLKRISGDWDKLSLLIEELTSQREAIWLEIIYDGDDIISGLRERLDQAVAGTGLEILRVRNRRVVSRILEQNNAGERLDELGTDQVFDRCLEAHKIPQEHRERLQQAYREIVSGLQDRGCGVPERGTP